MSNSSKINRRKFLRKGAQGYTGLTLSQGLSMSFISSLSCSVKEPTAKTVNGACYHDCPDTCSWVVSARDNEIINFKASTTNPFTNGKLCDKMDNFPDDVTYHADRILQPLKRIGKKGEGKFEAVSWEEALSDTAHRLQKAIDNHGPQAVLPYSFAGTEGLVQKNSIAARFFAKLGSSRLKRTICGDAAVTGVHTVYGQTTGILPEDIVHSGYIVIWGCNPVLSNQHLWPLIENARSNGAKIVVVDPFKSATAEKADQHIQLKPGTDVALALSMIHVLFQENLHNEAFIAKYTTGFEELKQHVQSYNPESVANLVGLDADFIRQFARDYAAGSPSLIRLLIGMEHQANGANAFRAVSMLPSIIGAWETKGGGFLHMTYELPGQVLNWSALEQANEMTEASTREINMIQIGKALNMSENPIKALFVYNSNPAVIAPDQNAVMNGLRREDLFTVVLEHFMTDTARFADYIFPATTQLEHWDLLTSWGQTYLNINEPVIPPRGESKPNTEIFRLLATAMGHTDKYLFESDLDIIKTTLNSDAARELGITFESFRRDGWKSLAPAHTSPFVTGIFNTPSHKIEFYSATLEKEDFGALPGLKKLERSKEDLDQYPLQLLAIKSTRNFLNSSHANVSHLIQKEGQPKIDIHPSDAEIRGIKDGAKVKAHNQRGEMILTAQLSEKVCPGVVCAPQGYWPSLLEGESSINALTTDQLTDKGEGAAFYETFVNISPLA